MERQCLSMVVHYLSLLVLLCSYYYRHCNAIESPQYTVVRSASNVEIRLYRESSWMSALVHGGTSSFNTSTKQGFHRLYQYIHGGNSNSSRIPITAPVLTTISQAASGSDYVVGFYLPAKYTPPPQPNTQLNLQLDSWKSHCIAVRKFSGFAKDENIKKERETLIRSLREMDNGKSATVLDDKVSYSVAQYNASFHLTGRLNEVWINVSDYIGNGCPT